MTQAESDPSFGGYLVMTVRPGDCLIIGDSIIRLKEIKSGSKASFAVKAKRHILVRRFADGTEDAIETEKV